MIKFLKTFSKFILNNFQIFLILFLTFLLYFKSIFFGFTDFDDTILISQNLFFLKDLNNIFESFKVNVFLQNFVPESYYRPVMLISLILDTQFYIKFAGIYHLTNIVIHLTNIFLVYFFLKELNIKKNQALILSIFFSIHPIMVHAVSWIPGRNDSLLTLFVLAYFLSILKLLKTRQNYLFVPIFIFCFLAVFTKETGLFLILLTVIFLYLFNKNGLKDIKLLIIIVGNILTILIWLILRKNAINVSASIISKQDILTFFKLIPGFFILIGKIFIPLNLSTVPIIRPYLVTLGIIVSTILALLIYISRGKDMKKIWFGLMFIFIFLAPSFYGSNPDFTFCLMDHRIYLPMIGILVIVSQIDFLNKIQNKNIYFPILCLLIFLCVLNFKHQENYRNTFNFWSNAVITSPENEISHFGMGKYFYDNGDLVNSEREYLKSLEINDKRIGAKNNLGLIYLDQGKFEEARKLFEAENQILETPDGFFNLGLSLYYLKDYKEAEKTWSKVLKINPNDVETLERLYLLQIEQKNIFAAEYYKNELIKRNMPLNF